MSTRFNLSIGKIVKSNSHIDYVCQIYGPGELNDIPAPEDYAFGSFVRIVMDGEAEPDLVGIIYNTILMNPEFGMLGPRLSPKPDLEIFSPDYLSEKATLVGILVVGSLPKDPDGRAFQGIPPLAAGVDAMVYMLSPEDMVRFHQGEDAPRLAYVPHLLSQATPLIPHLVLSVLDQVQGCFGEYRTELAVLRDNLAWRTQVEQVH